MKQRRLLLILVATAIAGLAVWAALAGGAAPAPQQAAAPASLTPGYQSYEYMVALSDQIGRRVVGTAGNAAARTYISDTLQADGYTPSVQDFPVKLPSGKMVTGHNVIAVKPGDSAQRVVIGAHFDSVNVGRGASDNASGVALLLQLAKDLKDQQTPCTLVFVAFDSEELGMIGSRYYVKNLAAQDKADTVLMVNFDSVAGGDQLGCYSEGGALAWPQLEIRDIARSQGTDIQTNPGLNHWYPYGTTGDWSDHAPFRKAGIDYLYFEATNWMIGAKDGYLNNAKWGEIWHSNKDTIAFFETNLKGRLLTQLSACVQSLETFLTTPFVMPSPAPSMSAVGAPLGAPSVRQ